MTDPFKITEPTCISFSGGRTSAYMLWRVLQSNSGLPSDALVCFANTGKEVEETLKFVQDCEQSWDIPINWLEYISEPPRFKTVNFDSASRNGEPFAQLIVKKNYLPNPIARFCTAELKVLTIDRYLKSIGVPSYETMVGIRADEKRRVAKMRDTKLTPLVDAAVFQKDVQDFWKSYKFDLGLSFSGKVTNLGNCDLCYLKGAHQIASLIADKPDRAVWWASMEEKIGATFRSDRPSYASMLKFSKEQVDMFDRNEEAISCFCGD